MSCWVVPMIAAEFLGVSVQQVMDRIKSGEIPTKQEAGFTFVDVAPESPRFEGGVVIAPPTYTTVTPEEIEALTAEEETVDEQSMTLGDWRAAREKTQKLRRPPMAA